MAEYLQSHERLAEVGVELGEMAHGTTYKQFMNLAEQTGIPHPRLMLAITWHEAQTPLLNMPDNGKTVYPIADYEWLAFIADIPTFMKDNPKVWVVDGSLYTAPI